MSSEVQNSVPLKTVMEKEHYDALKLTFPELNLDILSVSQREVDGKGGVIAYVRGSILRPSTDITLDSLDILVGGMLNPFIRSVGEVLCHELIHVMQSNRGFLERLSMWFYRILLPYEKRPAEVEAHGKSEEFYNTWLRLIPGSSVL